MEIERKFFAKDLPEELKNYKKSQLSQSYISSDPTIRIRRQDQLCYLTVKSKGSMAREEFELEISQETYSRLSKKTEGYTITKTRYFVPLGNYLTAEIDVFHGIFAPLVTIEVEFNTIDQANAFTPPGWFGEEITFDPQYKNSYLAWEGPFYNYK